MVTEDGPIPDSIEDAYEEPVRPFAQGGYIPTPEGCRLSAVFGYQEGEKIRKRSGEVWTVGFIDGLPYARRTPEHDTDPFPEIDAATFAAHYNRHPPTP